MQYCLSSVPTYPCGTLGYVIARRDSTESVKKPIREPEAEVLAQLKYYTPELHEASFALPKWLKDKFAEVAAKAAAKSA
jgi:spermidine synthase